MEIELMNNAKDMAKKNFCANVFSVGASLLCKDGKIYNSFNIENDGIQSICAERAAFIKALCDGQRQFEAIAVAGKYINSNEYIKTLPCGYCRQFMMQYAGRDLKVYVLLDNKEIKEYKLSELLPESFSFSSKD